MSKSRNSCIFDVTECLKHENQNIKSVFWKTSTYHAITVLTVSMNDYLYSLWRRKKCIMISLLLTSKSTLSFNSNCNWIKLYSHTAMRIHIILLRGDLLLQGLETHKNLNITKDTRKPRNDLGCISISNCCLVFYDYLKTKFYGFIFRVVTTSNPKPTYNKKPNRISYI